MSDNNYSKKYRLLSANDFSYLRKGAKSRQTQWIKIYFKSGSKERLEDNNYTRIGIAVSKKVGNAIVRVKLKRVIRETFRNSEYKNMSLDMVITVSPNLLKKIDVPAAIILLRKSFLSILPKLSVIKL